MLDRESTFANPEIVKFLTANVVSVAIDQAYQRRQKDTEGEFYRKIVDQSPRKNFGNKTTQGLYMASADGRFLGFTNHRSPDRVLRMLKEAWSSRTKTSSAPLSKVAVDRQFNPELPDGGLAVRVQARILGGYDKPETHFERIFQTSLSRDNLWITAAEHQQLIAGKVLDSLATRIARYHLVDNTRGEPTMWRATEIKDSKFSIINGRLTGHVELSSASENRSYTCDLLGFIEHNGSTVTRFDVVALGQFSGEGRYTRNAPKKPFPLGISFTLADGTDIADGIPPQGSRGWLDGYLKTR